MTATVTEIRPAATLEENAAWDAYAAIAQQVPENPKLLTERGFMERLLTAQRAFGDAYLRRLRSAAA